MPQTTGNARVCVCRGYARGIRKRIHARALQSRYTVSSSLETRRTAPDRDRGLSALIKSTMLPACHCPLALHADQTIGTLFNASLTTEVPLLLHSRRYSAFSSPTLQRRGHFFLPFVLLAIINFLCTRFHQAKRSTRY